MNKVDSTSSTAGINKYPVSILSKSISRRHRPVRVADGPMTARYRFTENASWVTNKMSVQRQTCPDESRDWTKPRLGNG